MSLEVLQNYPEKVRVVIESVANFKKVGVNRMLSRNRRPPLPYCRRLVCFALRNHVPELRMYQISEILGYKKNHKMASIYNQQVYDLMRIYDDVKDDVKGVDSLILKVK